MLDQLTTGSITQGEFESIYRALKKAIVERAMSAETSATAPVARPFLRTTASSGIFTRSASKNTTGYIGSSGRALPGGDLSHHLVRNASWKERKAIAWALRSIYAAATVETALEDFASSTWSQKYPTIMQSWERAWENVIPFFALPRECDESSTLQT